MLRKLVLVSVCLLLALAVSSLASAEPFAKIAVGVNGIWLQGTESSPAPWNADFEAGGFARGSLSPHISAVGSLLYGFSHSYFRYTGGVRFTVTDVENKDFSAGLGMQWHGASVAELRPEEWCPDAAIGFAPFPDKWPDLSVTAVGWYGLTTNKPGATLGLRYAPRLP